MLFRVWYVIVCEIPGNLCLGPWCFVIQGVSGPLRLGTNQAWARFRHAAFFLHLLKRHHDYQEGQENGERGVQRVPGEGAGDGTDGHYVFGREEGVPKIPLQVLAQVLEVKGIQVVTPTLDTLPTHA